MYDVLLIGEDRDFLFYKIPMKHGEKFGFVGKKYITNTRVSKKTRMEQNDGTKIDRTYFCGKHVFIEFSYKGSFIKSFFDFHKDDYLDVVVHSFSGLNVQLEFGREVKISEITKLEEL